MLQRTRLARIGWIGAIATCLVLLGGCGATQPVANSANGATPTTTIAQTTPPANPTSATTTFTCPVTLNGAQKTFTDTSMQFSFSYPAAWTESNCQRFAGNDGQQTLFIGNLFSVSVMPRGGRAIQQWVNAQSNQYEIVTLGALTVPQAQEAATISVAPSATSDPNKAFDAEPFAQSFAIVAGTRSFYVVNGFVAQFSITDTMPNLTRQQLAQQIVTTFAVS
jgi:hypothetical protein